jgi:hypothetical protein
MAADGREYLGPVHIYLLIGLPLFSIYLGLILSP